MNSISANLNIMIKAAEKASKVLIRDFGELEKLQVSKKGPSDFVTNSDKKVEKIILEELLKSRKKYSILSEEVSRIKNPIIGTRLAILEVLSDSGSFGMSGGELQKKLEISRQLLSHHLMELRNGEYVEAASEARRPKWRLSDNGMNALVSSREISRIEAAA